MRNLWDETAAQRCKSPLALRAYSSRLIGSDRTLVLHGGGNTSLKLGRTLYVKGTGADLAAVTEEHFTALDLAPLRALLQDEHLQDADMMRHVDSCKLEAAAARPSIEAPMHAILPHPCIEHAHADAILAVANVDTCEQSCAAAFGDLAPVVPYHHSGAALARACKTVYDQRATSRTIGLILAFHGVVAFGGTLRESYANLQRLVGCAENFLQQRGAPPAVASEHAVVEQAASVETPATARLRDAISTAAAFPMAMHVVCTPATLAYARRTDIAEISRQGPPTPQHAIYTRRVPLLGQDVTAYVTAYREYLGRTLGSVADGRIDPTPRIALDPEFGLCAFGVSDRHAAIAAEIYLHDIDIITRASAHGTYRAASEQDMAHAELEYGGFEQRVRTRIASGSSLTG